MLSLGKSLVLKAPSSFEPCIANVHKISSERIQLAIDVAGRGLALGKTSSATPSIAMIYYSLDPQFATLLFSVYSRNERLGFSVFPDVFCSTVSSPPSSSILSYAHTVGLQLIALGEHYANFLSQVRAGSVIFLVGVGSLVCWKIWDYWNSGGNIDPPFSPPSKSPSSQRPSKTPTKSSKTFFASLLEEEFVHDFDDFEDEDPALIQGKYFGPESPVENKATGFRKPEKNRLASKLYRENASPLTSEYSAKSHSESEKQYLADNSASYSADDDGGSMTSDLEEDSLPFDGIAEPVPKVTRKVKRKHHRSERSSLLEHSKNSVHSKACCETQPEIKNVSFLSKRFHPYDRNVNSFDDFSSSETSPIGRPNRQEMVKLLRQSRLSSFQRCREMELENQDTDEIKDAKTQQTHLSSTPPLYANYNSDEDWISSGRQQPEGEEDMAKPSRKSLSRDVSLVDLMGRLRKRGSQKSLSRDNSVSSRLSDFLRRDDSICSNLSEFGNSECSEFSLDLSIKDESIANQTITSLADIEDELNTLKSSVLEMDEEFLKFASKPNPYLLKTTFSDYSLESSDSRPLSSLDLINVRPQAQLKTSLNGDTVHKRLNDSSPFASDEVNSVFLSSEERKIGDEAKATPQSLKRSKAGLAVEVDGSQDRKGYCRKNFIPQHKNSIKAALKLSVQDETVPSLEWDNDGCLKQYDEEQEISAAVGDEHQLERFQFLPDHSSLELDLEKELRSPVDSHPSSNIFASSLSPSVQLSPLIPSSESADFSSTYCKSFVEFSSCSSVEAQGKKLLSYKSHPPTSLSMKTTPEMLYNSMTTSVDSAIGLHSAPGSRSGSSSPVSHLLTQSLMRYEALLGICASIKNSPAGDNINSFETERCKQHLTQLNHLINHSEIDRNVFANTFLQDPLICSTLGLSPSMKPCFATNRNSTYTSSCGGLYSESFLRENECNPCSHCKNLLLRIDLLKAQYAFLFQERTPTPNSPEARGDVQRRKPVSSQQDPQGGVFRENKETNPSNRDSAIELSMISSTDTLFHRET